MAEDEELEELRRKKMEEMREEEQQSQEEAVERQRKQIWQEAKDYMTDGAIDRLSNIRAVDEQKAYSVAQQIIALGESGRIGTVDEDQMKEILREIQKDKEENQSNIKFRK